MSESIPQQLIKRMNGAPFKEGDRIVGYIEQVSYDVGTETYSAIVKTIPEIEIEAARLVGGRLERCIIKVRDYEAEHQLSQNIPLEAAFNDAHFSEITYR